jgi:hypothetical protein
MSTQTTTHVTPYAAAKVINKLLADKGIEKTLPPQMFYNYAKKGYLGTLEDGKVSLENLATWADKYIAKLTATVTA